jgi:hypothetical protein
MTLQSLPAARRVPATPERDPLPIALLSLLLWTVAGAVAFLPFAFSTSPWDALILRVPGHQGNWWHALVGFPAFLAYPNIWLRLRALVSAPPLTAAQQRPVWTIVVLSVAGTVAVETPFLLHLAGTRGWPRLSLLIVGFGILIVSGVLLFLERRRLSALHACMAGLNAAWLANMALCLVVYAGAAGALASRVGWFIAIVILWPVILELAWLFSRGFRQDVLPPQTGIA